MTVEETRRRIVEATRALHQEVGPADTTITAIAERAGVQRLTVYRHFEDDAALIGACSADWAEDHPLPDPAVWAGMGDPERRLREALGALYGYYRGGAPMLEQVLRDEGRVPELAEVLTPWWGYVREVAAGLSAGWDTPPETQRLVRAAVGHAVHFRTWQTLAAQGLDDGEAVELMVGMVREAAEDGRASGASSDRSP